MKCSDGMCQSQGCVKCYPSNATGFKSADCECGCVREDDAQKCGCGAVICERCTVCEDCEQTKADMAEYLSAGRSIPQVETQFSYYVGWLSAYQHYKKEGIIDR